MESEKKYKEEVLSSCVASRLISSPWTIENYLIYFEACGDRNRNMKIALLLFKLVYNTNIRTESTDHKFMVSSYSFLLNEVEFGWLKLL